MTPAPASPRGSDYAALSRQVRQSGLLGRRPWYYTWKITLTAAALALGWATFAAIGNSWWQSFCAERDVSYTETSLLASYAQALGHLAAVGSELAIPVAASKAVP